MSKTSKTFQCPYCGNKIPHKRLAGYFGQMGGQVSKRGITPEQQAKMQAARCQKEHQRGPTSKKEQE